MRILVLDDDIVRHENVKRNRKSDDIIGCLTYQEATVSVLYSDVCGPFDIVYLDHDLGIGQPTGAIFAKFLTSLSRKFRPKRVIIISMNPVGRTNIRAILKGRIRCDDGF